MGGTVFQTFSPPQNGVYIMQFDKFLISYRQDQAIPRFQVHQPVSRGAIEPKSQLVPVFIETDVLKRSVLRPVFPSFSSSKRKKVDEGHRVQPSHNRSTGRTRLSILPYSSTN